MDTRIITESTYTVSQLLSRQYLTDASAFRSSSQAAKPMMAVKKMFMVGPCGQECLLPLLWVTSLWSNGPSVCKRIWRSLGTAIRTTILLLNYNEHMPSPWKCKIGGEFYTGRYLFTVDYAESDVSEDPSQHKQSHVLVLTDAGQWTGNIVALPNNRVRATSPAYWVTGEGAPDFRPSQWIHCAEQDDSYMDPEATFNNLYKE
jgi:hypothetical protein